MCWWCLCWWSWWSRFRLSDDGGDGVGDDNDAGIYNSDCGVGSPSRVGLGYMIVVMMVWAMLMIW